MELFQELANKTLEDEDSSSSLPHAPDPPRPTPTIVIAQRGKSEGWSSQEEAALIDAVAHHRYRNWKAVAIMVGTKGPAACHQKAMALLGLNKRPGGASGRWSQEELDLLKEGMEIYPDDWDMVARVVGSRTSSQCRERVKNTGMELARTTADVKVGEEAVISHRRSAAGGSN